MSKKKSQDNGKSHHKKNLRLAESAGPAGPAAPGGAIPQAGGEIGAETDAITAVKADAGIGANAEPETKSRKADTVRRHALIQEPDPEKDFEKIDFHGRPMHVVTNKYYEKELRRLQIELVKLQEWIKAKGLKVVVIFEGRDAAGKGGVIKRITEALNPRICRVEALPAPTPKEETQWFFQRYVARLPAAGEMVLFDRSWYNRAGVEHVMNFCTEDEYNEFLRSCPEFEKMLIRSGIILIKYWFSVSDEEQDKRFQDRLNDPTKAWKLSPMDLESRNRWVEYSRAKDVMFAFTDTRQSPWYVVNSDIKKHARLNCISHLLSMIPYEEITPRVLKLEPRKRGEAYIRPPISDQTFVPDLCKCPE